MSEAEFLREFKLMMIEGLIIKKYCIMTINNKEIYYKYVFRNFYIKHDEHKLCWNSKKKDNPFIKYHEIIKIMKNKDILLPFSISKELLKRVLVIKVRNKKDIILEFINDYSCELFYDGMILLLQEYKKIVKEEESKNNKKSILKRILTEELLKDSSDEE